MLPRAVTPLPLTSYAPTWNCITYIQDEICFILIQWWCIKSYYIIIHNWVFVRVKKKGCKSKVFIWYDMIYLLTAMGLTPGGSSTVHIYTQTIHRMTQSTQTTHLTNWEECGLCPLFASYTLAFALQLRIKHRKTSVRVAEECQLAWWKQNIQNRAYITIRVHKHNSKNT